MKIRNLLCLLGLAFFPALESRGAPPALVVVIVIDQFRADYLTRFQPYFSPGGFNRLLEGGANFTDCHYRHAITKTAAGHATILSGVHANVHGIIANDWIDRTTFQRMNSVGDDSVQPLGGPAGSSPRNFLATTVGDEFKVAHGGRPKVIAISSKDRSAVLLGGQFADAAYWMEKGRMASSTYYLKELPAWVRAFNEADRVDTYYGRTWDHLLPAAVYDQVQGPDDVAEEYAGQGFGRTLPKRIDGGAGQITPAFYEAFANSPFENELLTDFARAVLENENLGKRGVTDFLCISYSANDNIGHIYGPDSHEMMDVTLRTDRMLADLFQAIDARVGLQNCTIVLTGDHGVAPMPERLKALNPKFDTGRIENAQLLAAGEAALDRAFGPLPQGRHWGMQDGTWMLFFPDALREKKVTRAAAELVVRDAWLTLNFVARAFTRTELEAGHAAGPYGESALLSFSALRSGDVCYQAKPFWVDRATGANHNTPYNYDTHVPLLWFGVGVKPGTYVERVGVDDLAPTLAHLLGISAPPEARGRVLF